MRTKEEPLRHYKGKETISSYHTTRPLPCLFNKMREFLTDAHPFSRICCGQMEKGVILPFYDLGKTLPEKEKVSPLTYSSYSAFAVDSSQIRPEKEKSCETSSLTWIPHRATKLGKISLFYSIFPADSRGWSADLTVRKILQCDIKLSLSSFLAENEKSAGTLRKSARHFSLFRRYLP